MSKVVVVGGGVAGVETALTIARTLPRAHVTLVTQWPSLRVLPEIVYVPFGGRPIAVDVHLRRALAADGIALHTATCERVNTDAHELHLTAGRLEYDSVVFAPGTVAEPTKGHQLRTLDDALALRKALADLSRSDARDRSISVHVPESCGWAPPAFELSLLLAQWRDEIAAHDIDLSVTVEASMPLDQFGLDAANIVEEELKRARVSVMLGVPQHRIDLIECTIPIEFASLSARRIIGLPPVTASGFYATDEHGQVAPDAFVVGDAVDMPYKAGFAVGWHARRVASTLGGDLSILGTSIDQVPIDQCEYQMDLGTKTLRVRFQANKHLSSPYLSPVTNVEVVENAPVNFAGTLVRTLIDSQWMSDVTDYSASKSSIVR